MPYKFDYIILSLKIMSYKFNLNLNKKVMPRRTENFKR